MKPKTLLVFSLIFGWIHAVGQNADTTNFDYRLDSTLTERFHKESQDWVPTGKEIFSYNEDSILVYYLSSLYDMDSGAWYPNELKEFEFGENGNLFQMVYQQYDSQTHEVLGGNKTQVTYDEENNMSSFNLMQWDTLSSTWKNDYMKEYQYLNHKETSELGYVWDSEKDIWQAKDKETSTYNTLGEIETFTDYNFNTGNDTWLPSYRIEYQYGSNESLVQTKKYDWNPDSLKWILDEREFIFYVGENIEMILTQKFDPEEDALINKDKKEFAFNDSSLLTECAYYFWEPELETWMGQTKFENDISPENEITGSREYLWNDTLMDWDGEVYTEYEMQDNNIEESFNYSWDEGSRDWMQYDRISYVFDQSADSSIILNPQWIHNTKKIVTSQTDMWNKEKSEYEPYELTHYYYTDLSNTSSILNLKQLEISMYPNPADERINISCKTADPGNLRIELINSQGKLVLAKDLKSENSIEVRHLKADIYFILISDKTDLLFKDKIIIQH